MGIIRGKIESDREIVPKEITVGDSPWLKCSCGCEKWFDKKTGKEIEVMIQSFDEFLNNKPLCKIEEK